ncbi:MAG: hypothetical protein KF819_30420 [Labilithrix sp.]|nr:hypothetical protein [Labilithrix sp.]
MAVSSSRTRRAIALVAVLLLPIALVVALRRPYPSDRTPEGAYMRIARAVAEGEPRSFFAYLEQEAQWACFTIRDARAKATQRIEASYPEPQRTQMLAQYAAAAKAPDGSDVFALFYAERGWARRLRKDMSGVVKVDVEGERASVVTAQGTRWPFRLRDNGIWGITVFTAELVAESEKATRDLAVVNAAADDYDRASGRAK